MLEGAFIAAASDNATLLPLEAELVDEEQRLRHPVKVCHTLTLSLLCSAVCSCHIFLLLLACYSQQHDSADNTETASLGHGCLNLTPGCIAAAIRKFLLCLP